jgi:hypothetical protein
MSTPRAESAAAPELEALRGQYLAALDLVDIAHDHVRHALDDAAAALTIVRGHVEDGGLVSDFAGLIDPKSLRGSLSRSLAELERSRHNAQRLLFRILQAEGKRKSDIARIWGISRQLVSRMVNEPD